MASIHLRLVAWYVTVIGAVSMAPFYAVILSDAGLTSSQVAASLALIPVGTLIGGPLWALVADRTGSPRRVLMLSATLGAIAAGLLLGARTGLLLTGALLLLALARAPLISVGDALVLRVLPGGPSHYGSVRLWGSVAFLLGAWLNGWLRETWPRAPLWVGFVLMVGAIVAAWGLPSPPAAPRPALRAAFGALRSRPALGALLVVGVLHGFGVTTYDNLYSLHIEGLGLPSRVVGQAVAVGVGAEVAMMAISRRLLGRVSAQWLLVAAVASGVPRWWLTGAIEAPGLQVAAQTLHGLTFGAYWVAAVALLGQAAPRGLESSTQALLPVSTFGMGYVLSMSVAALALGTIDPGTLFRTLSVTSLLATGVAIVVAVRWPKVAHLTG